MTSRNWKCNVGVLRMYELFICKAFLINGLLFCVSVLQTVVHWIIIVGSVALYFIVTLAYSGICVTCNPPSNPYWILQSQMADPLFYLLCLITTVVALLPRYFQRYSACQSLRRGESNFMCPCHSYREAFSGTLFCGGIHTEAFLCCMS